MRTGAGKSTVNPIDVASHRHLLRPSTATVVDPSILYHYYVLVAFCGHHRPAMTYAHCEYLLVLRSALFPVSPRVNFEDNLNELSI